MTRRVNFEAQQRVDRPDVQAMQTFLLQDFRRVVRQVVMGDDAPNDNGRVLTGFKVEPENAGVSPRVVIKLDLSGGFYGAFMGAIDQGAGLTDWGQLGGDKDGLGNLEGSAQNLLDFTGQPAAKYDVKVRAKFGAGVLDNRAFWNPGTNAEFIKPTNTRMLPQWEVAFSGHADPEWVTLAEVDWDGAAVAANDIVDLRQFPIEGTPRNAATSALQWSHSDQNDGDTNGVGDFDRNADRGATGVQLGAIWEQVRALGRQVQDIKGGRESDLRYDWFSRPFAPAAFLDADPTEKKTKNLRSIDVITFTVADGTTEHGDFNGTTALYDCFKFIEDEAANLPDRIHVVVKSRQGGGAFTWLLPVTITSKVIEVVGIGDGQNAVALSPVGMAQVDIDPVTSGLGAGHLLTIAGRSVVKFENILLNTPPAGVGWIECGLGSALHLTNVTVLSTEVGPGGSVAVMVRAPSEGLRIIDSLLAGNYYLGGRDETVLTATTGERIFQDLLWAPGVVQGTSFTGLVRLRHDDLDGATATQRSWPANHLSFTDCQFFEVVATATGGAAVDGQIDVTAARFITFERCEFLYHGDQDCIHGYSAQIFTVPATFRLNINELTIRDCMFQMTNSATHPGSLTGAGGVNGLNGTGWAIALGAVALPAAPVSGGQFPTNIRVEDSVFKAGFESDNVTLIRTSPDAGAIIIGDSQHVWLDKNEFMHWTFPVLGQTSDIQSIIRCWATFAGFALNSGTGYHLTANIIGKWGEGGAADAAWGSQTLRCIDLVLLNAPIAHRNFVSALIETAADTIRVGNSPSALVVDTCGFAQITENHFSNWRDSILPLTNSCVELGTNTSPRLAGNLFTNCGGINVVIAASGVITSPIIHGNIFNVGPDRTKFMSALSTIGGATTLGSFIGNHWDFLGAGGSRDFIVLDASQVAGIISGNHATAGNIAVDTAGGVAFNALRGYAPEDAVGNTFVLESGDPNSVLGYT